MRFLNRIAVGADYSAFRVGINSRILHTSTDFSYTAVAENDHTNNAITGAVETVGLAATVRYRGSASSTTASGTRQVSGVFVSAFNTNTGTTGRVQAFSFDVRNLGAGTIQEMVGAAIPAFVNSGGGSVTTAYGILVGDINVAAAGSNWAIWTNAGWSRFGDRIYAPGLRSNPAAPASGELFVDANGFVRRG